MLNILKVDIIAVYNSRVTSVMSRFEEAAEREYYYYFTEYFLRFFSLVFAQCASDI